MKTVIKITKIIIIIILVFYVIFLISQKLEEVANL